MKLYGSLVNRMSEDYKSPVPEIGMGATVLGYSDRHAYTIVKVDKDGKRAWMTADTALRDDTWDYYKQNYVGYTSNFTSSDRREIRICNDERWREVNSVWRTIKDHPEGGKWGTSTQGASIVLLGSRSEYQDPSF